MLVDPGEAWLTFVKQRPDVRVIFAAVPDRLFEDRWIGSDSGHPVLLDQPLEPALGEETPVEKVQPHRLTLRLERLQSIGHHVLSAIITRRATLTKLGTVKPNLSLSFANGADAPNVLMVTVAPSGPT